MSFVVVDASPAFVADNLRLELDGVDPLPLENAYGFIVSQVDLGWPNPRTVAQDRAGQDGTFDLTGFHGARAVSVTGCIVGDDNRTRQDILDGLRRFCHPGARPTLFFRTEQGGDERKMILRADQQSAPMQIPGLIEFTAAWIAPDGVALSVDLNTITMLPFTDAGGFTFDLTFDLTFPYLDPALGRGLCHNAGNTWAVPTIVITGPCTDPSVTNETTDLVIAFDGLALSAGESVVIDPSRPSVLLNGEAGASRYSLLDFDVTTMWLLQAGDNTIRFTAEAESAGASCVVAWHDTYL